MRERSYRKGFSLGSAFVTAVIVGVIGLVGAKCMDEAKAENEEIVSSDGLKGPGYDVRRSTLTTNTETLVVTGWWAYKSHPWDIGLGRTAASVSVKRGVERVREVCGPIINRERPGGNSQSLATEYVQVQDSAKCFDNKGSK